jgi:hypothetical protein
VRHDQIVAYMTALAAASPRVRLTETGRTHERKPLLVLTISSPANLANLEALRDAHAALASPGAAVDLESLPVVVYLGYSVHGNEASGSNAALLVAYHLAAARGPEIEALLARTVVLLDPAFNPDGLQRFATWANMHRGKNAAAEPLHREHREAWPSGRTNHYWFDLNRDWLVAQHPETRARLRVFHAWKPNVLADFHEMGSDATFFFQPGVTSRKHPLTPEANVTLTKAIAAHHVRALDARRALYFSEEIFDDFYYGKGSTFPDAHGAVGILFEQASARGHRQRTDHGMLDFPFAIGNHFTVSLSTLAGALEQRAALLRYQQEFFADALDLARRDPVKGWVVGDAADRGRTFHLLDILVAQDIQVHELARPHIQDGRRFEPGSAFVVPAAQPQYRLLQALFERRTTFEDSLFYDVSAWTLPLAMGLPASALGRAPGDLLGAAVTSARFPSGRAPSREATYAYAFAWSEYYAPRALVRLQRAGVRARVASAPFTLARADGGAALDYGSIVVPLGTQEVPAGRIAALMQEIAREDAVDVHALSTGLTDAGSDLGSSRFRSLARPKPALVVGAGVSTYDAGEVWHLLDHRFDMELPLVEMQELNETDLARFTHILLVDGDYENLGERRTESLKRWVQGGGVLVATKRAARWAAKQQFAKVEFKDTEAKPAPGDSVRRLAYAGRESQEGAQEISGAIFAADLDTTHPLAYGYRDRLLPVFRDHRLFMRRSQNAYANVAVYRAEPQLAGYISKPNLALLAGTAAVVAERLGRGAVILILDDPNFRSFWFGTNRLLLNALFFGSILE